EIDLGLMEPKVICALKARVFREAVTENSVIDGFRVLRIGIGINDSLVGRGELLSKRLIEPAMVDKAARDSRQVFHGGPRRTNRNLVFRHRSQTETAPVFPPMVLIRLTLKYR